MAESDNHKTLFFGEDCLINSPAWVQVRQQIRHLLLLLFLQTLTEIRFQRSEATQEFYIASGGCIGLELDCFFLHLHIYFCHLYPWKYIFILLVSPVVFGLFSDYVINKLIWKQIFRLYNLNKISELCNPKSNYAYEKRLLNYVIQKLITNLKNNFRILRNLKYYKRNSKIYGGEKRKYEGPGRNSPWTVRCRKPNHLSFILLNNNFFLYMLVIHFQNN